MTTDSAPTSTGHPPSLPSDDALASTPDVMTTVATDEQSPPARPATRTLAWLQFLSVIVVLLFSLGSVIGITTARDGAIRGSESLSQYVRLQQLQSHLYSSMSTAVTQQLTGGKANDATLSTLSTASQLVVEAGKAGSQDQRLLQLQDALTTYAYRLGALTTGNAQGPGSLAGATDALHQANLLASAIVDSSRERLDQMVTSRNWWPLPLTAVAALMLLWVSLVLAKRSHRVINLGVLLALIFVIGGGSTSYFLMDTSIKALESARAGELEQTRLLADARTALNQARDAEGRSLLASDASHEQQWSESMKRAGTSLAQASSVRDAQSRVDAIDLSRYSQAHQQLRSSVASGKIAEGIESSTKGDAAQAFADVDNRIRLSMEASQQAARLRAGDPTDDLLYAALALGGLGVAAAGFAWWGVGARIREFR